jgi:hypothetical protein
MRQHVRKVQYKAHVRDRVLSGMVNMPDGNWTPASGRSSTCSESSVRHSLCGTMGKAFKYGNKKEK